MAEIDVTHMSSKGQIVIPRMMRKDFKEGEKLIIIKTKKGLILKRIRDFDKNIQEDIIFAQRTEAALQRHEKGLSKKMGRDEFLKELESW